MGYRRDKHTGVNLIGFALAGPLKPVVDDTDEVMQPPEELGNYFEGHIVLRSSRTGQLNPASRWPNNTLVYAFAPNINKAERNSVIKALRQISKRSCVKFVERTTEKDYVQVTKDQADCFSNIGRQGGAQIINLQAKGCIK
ncbi:Metalloendopeptidase [Sergentomyia squamirostris]